jgi:hypothetical protein
MPKPDFPITRLRASALRVATRRPAARPAGGDPKQIAKGLKRVADSLSDVLGEDERESRTIRNFKGDVGEKAGELVQDLGLLVRDVLLDLSEALEDGTVSAYEARATFFGLLGYAPELIADASNLTDD